jgi:hypothetical protein
MNTIEQNNEYRQLINKMTDFYCLALKDKIDRIRENIKKEGREEETYIIFNLSELAYIYLFEKHGYICIEFYKVSSDSIRHLHFSFDGRVWPDIENVDMLKKQYELFKKVIVNMI